MSNPPRHPSHLRHARGRRANAVATAGFACLGVALATTATLPVFARTPAGEGEPEYVPSSLAKETEYAETIDWDARTGKFNDFKRRFKPGDKILVRLLNVNTFEDKYTITFAGKDFHPAEVPEGLKALFQNTPPIDRTFTGGFNPTSPSEKVEAALRVKHDVVVETFQENAAEVKAARAAAEAAAAAALRSQAEADKARAHASEAKTAKARAAARTAQAAADSATAKSKTAQAQLISARQAQKATAKALADLYQSFQESVKAVVQETGRARYFAPLQYLDRQLLHDIAGGGTNVQIRNRCVQRFRRLLFILAYTDPAYLYSQAANAEQTKAEERAKRPPTLSKEQEDAINSAEKQLESDKKDLYKALTARRRAREEQRDPTAVRNAEAALTAAEDKVDTSRRALDTALEPLTAPYAKAMAGYFDYRITPPTERATNLDVFLGMTPGQPVSTPGSQLPVLRPDYPGARAPFPDPREIPPDSAVPFYLNRYIWDLISDINLPADVEDPDGSGTPTRTGVYDLSDIDKGKILRAAARTSETVENAAAISKLYVREMHLRAQAFREAYLRSTVHIDPKTEKVDNKEVVTTYLQSDVDSVESYGDETAARFYDYLIKFRPYLSRTGAIIAEVVDPRTAPAHIDKAFTVPGSIDELSIKVQLTRDPQGLRGRVGAMEDEANKTDAKPAPAPASSSLLAPLSAEDLALTGSPGAGRSCNIPDAGASGPGSCLSTAASSEAPAEDPPASSKGGINGAAAETSVSEVTAGVERRWTWDFSAGVALSDLVDRNYHVVPGPVGVPSLSRVIAEGASSGYNGSLGLFAHVYKTGLLSGLFGHGDGMLTPDSIGLTIGLPVSDNKSLTRFFVGGSVILGRKSRTILTFGKEFGKVRRLGVDRVGQPPVAGATDADIKTDEVWRDGFFFGVSFSLNLAGSGGGAGVQKGDDE